MKFKSGIMKRLFECKCLRCGSRSCYINIGVFFIFVIVSSAPYLMICWMNRSFDIISSKKFAADNTVKYLRDNQDFCPSLFNTAEKTIPLVLNSLCTSSVENETLRKLEEITQSNVFRLQNPIDCKSRRLLVCSVTWKPGFGSLVHLLAECLLLALGTNRTMVADLSGWWYRSVEDVFEPFTSCGDTDISTAVEWKGRTDLKPEISKHRIIRVYIARKRPYSIFVPFNLPHSLKSALECSHSDPNAWWMGQIIKYFMRLRPIIKEKIQATKKILQFSHPIVGIHVRRTDKSRESNFFRLESYMAYADRWFDCNYTNKGKNVIRRVYIATDDSSVIKEARSKYENYEVYHDPLFLKHRKLWWNRFTYDGNIGVLTDIQLLMECDYFVGTYSSNLGRIVNELKQAESDRTLESVSLDRGYYYHNGATIRHIATNDHSSHGGDIELKVGDEIIVDTSYPYPTQGRGTNLRTRNYGTYPISKVRIKVNTASYAGFS